MMRQLLSSILLTALIATAVEAQTIRKVPQDFTTIQAAIVAAQNGDTVRVAPGIYVERINFPGQVDHRSERGRSGCHDYDGSLAGTVVQISNGEASSTVLDGFTIQNGKGQNDLAGGIQIAGSPTIRHNRIIKNVACFGGVGISISSGSPIIQANFISNNVTQGCSGGDGGAGIQIKTSGSTQILDNTISNNSNNASRKEGGVSDSGAGPTLIRGNIITGNTGNVWRWNRNIKQLGCHGYSKCNCGQYVFSWRWHLLAAVNGRTCFPLRTTP